MRWRIRVKYNDERCEFGFTWILVSSIQRDSSATSLNNFSATIDSTTPWLTTAMVYAKRTLLTH